MKRILTILFLVAGSVACRKDISLPRPAEPQSDYRILVYGNAHQFDILGIGEVEMDTTENGEITMLRFSNWGFINTDGSKKNVFLHSSGGRLEDVLVGGYTISELQSISRKNKQHEKYNNPFRDLY